jgi:hypothetical protein
VTLVAPDYGTWTRHYPDGFGASVFSGPALQRIMAALAAPWWRPRHLVIEGPRRVLTLPVLAREASFARIDLRVVPVAYYVTPIESAVLATDEVVALQRALCTPAIRSACAWLPPWSTDVDAVRSFAWSFGDMRCTWVPTWLVRRTLPFERHMREVAHHRHRRELLHNQRRGLELVRDPSPADRRAYVELYHREHARRGWCGEPWPIALFDGVVDMLGRGGELVTMRRGGRVVGGGVLLYDRHAVHYFQGVMDRDERGVHPMAELMAYALRRSEELDVPHVNFGGVNDENQSLVAYKASWGAQAVRVARLWWQSGPRVVAARLMARGDLLAIPG